MIFADEQHKDFYFRQLQKCVNDSYTRALIYTLGISEITRSRFNKLYDVEKRQINPEQLDQG